jgi:hypothetical protein
MSIIIYGRKVHKFFFFGKSKGKRPLGRPGRWWEDGIRMNLTVFSFGVWSGLNGLRIWSGGGLL